MNIGDSVYVIRHKIKNHKNIGYYVDTVKVCEASCGYNNPKYICVRLANKERRMYLKHRIHIDYNEALKECNFKNKEKQLRDEYNKQKQLLRKENN